MPTQTDPEAGTDKPAGLRHFQLRGRFLTAVALRIETDRLDASFYDALDAQLQQTPHFFSDAPLVLDMEKAGGLTNAAQLRVLIDQLRRRNLMVFGMQGGNEEQLRAAAKHGLIPVAPGRDAPMPEKRRRATETPEQPRPAQNVTITMPVRSGQTVVAEHGDLTIIGSVASGAELVAAGNIHIYGRMRGRAMAGVHGDESARIFCRSLDAELLAIAGLYRTSDTIDSDLLGKPVQVYLDDDRLCMEALA